MPTSADPTLGPADDLSVAAGVRVIVCDDHRVFAEALAAVLRGHGYLVADVVQDPRKALELLAAETVDLCVMDLGFPDADGIEFTRRIGETTPSVKVFVLTARTGPDVLRLAMAAGASGVASKERGIGDVVRAIGRVVAGELYCDDHLLRDALGLGADTDRAHAQFLATYLTKREREVLDLLVQGQTTDAMAGLLHISKTTVRTHIQSVLSKFGAHSRLEAVAYAIANGIVPPPT
ncbi:response regulator transcription factor [Kribbella sp. NBC_01245]|uniref:response regulator transcription factor n=1 Tax=Kribbella sp. NBC_01245 TaxID=2903578 RepID=UPI002E2B3703|nr:response regulator transcription factor [Kribbella sp. NBC_01245]